MEFSLLVAVAIGAAAAWSSLSLIHRSDPGLRRSALDLVVIGVLAGIGGGRLWAMVAAGTNPITHPVDILIVRGGVDPIAATIAAVVAVAWSARRELWPYLDAVAPGAVFGLAGWHAGCLVRGACLGSPTDLPWGFAATTGSAPRHPVEIYTALLLVAAALGVVWLWRHRPGSGLATLAALVTAAAARALTEPMRPVLGNGRLLEYAVGSALALVALGALWWRRRGHTDT